MGRIVVYEVTATAEAGGLTSHQLMELASPGPLQEVDFPRIVCGLDLMVVMRHLVSGCRVEAGPI